MATLSPELMTQRTAIAVVSVFSDNLPDAAAEGVWLSTQNLGSRTSVLTKAVTSSPDQQNVDVRNARVDAAAPSPRT